MRVSIEVNAAVMRLVPYTLSVMEQDNHLSSRFDLQVALNAFQRVGADEIANVVGHHVIVIAENHIDVSVQTPDRVLEITVGHEGKVTKVVNCILWLDQSIPVLDQCLVHLIHIVEWTIRVLNDVFVTPMGITDKVDIAHFFSGSRSVLLEYRTHTHLVGCVAKPANRSC